MYTRFGGPAQCNCKAVLHNCTVLTRWCMQIGMFLKAVKEQLMVDFRELRHVSVGNLVYVKEDIILPHHHTFYELIANKVRGRDGL